ncbi:50S ribosomal protein L4 [Abyssibacter profundi]|uniref:Large ribosomal subunit protein uL4 n=1 Tax=Abyssibacter profundi TaxID=2182787 RepID=A0A363UIT7_9GAMM|nr:50S ribosomal protein L4 [Abyssibacter profundi]MBV59744.1 50S ribosomal protein L4 [Nevskiales bacterium]PWN55334.1 50S ribosomal protein L4 [Abyssibacter profundi]
MDLQIHNGSTVSVSDAVFGAEFNESLVHQVVVAYLAGGRAGTKAQKGRSDVRGGGRKPWRQKGTGRARAGTIRSPIFTGGGKVFAATPRDFSQKVNRKMYRGGLRAILSELQRQERLIVVDDLSLEAPKTKALIGKLAELNAPRALVVLNEVSESLYLASRNIPYVDVIDTAALNPAALVGADKVVISVAAIERVQEWLA